jgi:hypothetical protein
MPDVMAALFVQAEVTEEEVAQLFEVRRRYLLCNPEITTEQRQLNFEKWRVDTGRLVPGT